MAKEPMSKGVYRPFFDAWDEAGPASDADQPIQITRFAPVAPISRKEIILIAACALLITFGVGAIAELSLKHQSIVNQESDVIYSLSEDMEDRL
jgi:hypothetical protein